LLQPKSSGEPVNVHVVESVSEPKPTSNAGAETQHLRAFSNAIKRPTLEVGFESAPRDAINAEAPSQTDAEG
jgi:hypothetical protein